MYAFSVELIGIQIPIVAQSISKYDAINFILIISKRTLRINGKQEAYTRGGDCKFVEFD